MAKELILFIRVRIKGFHVYGDIIMKVKYVVYNWVRAQGTKHQVMLPLNIRIVRLYY